MNTDKPEPGAGVRYLLMRTKDGVVAVRNGSGQDGWRQVMGGAATLITGAMGTSPRQPIESRFFQIHPGQVSDWDRLFKHGSDGYMYGIGWDKDQKIARNFQFKEVSPGTSGTSGRSMPVDLVTAAYFAQLQSQVAALESKIDALAITAGDIREHQTREQLAGVLATVDTINEIYASFMRNERLSVTNADRAARLEHGLRKACYEVIAEMHSLAVKLGARTVLDAREGVHPGTGQRAGDVASMASLLALALDRWGLLLLAGYIEKEQWNEVEVTNAMVSIREQEASLREAQEALRAACEHTYLESAPWGKMLMTRGMVRGWWEDDGTRKLVAIERTEADNQVSRALEAITQGLVEPPAEIFSLVEEPSSTAA